jgi:hypothetical protein
VTAAIPAAAEGNGALPGHGKRSTFRLHAVGHRQGIRLCAFIVESSCDGNENVR